MTLPLQLLGKSPENTPSEHFGGQYAMQANPKSDYWVWDYVANLLGYADWQSARADGTDIVCLNTKKCSPELLQKISFFEFFY